MALQDLTPQLRTRLSKVERAVGWFVILAVALFAAGFAYYAYHTAQNRGWFKTKAKYFTFLDTAQGLKIGDPVKLMGSDAGRITDIQPMPPMEFSYNIYVEFELLEPNYGYMWTEGSRAKVMASDFLGKRALEVTKGTGGHAIYISFPVRKVSIAEARNLPESQWRLAEDVYRPNSTQLVARAFSSLTNLNSVAAAGKTQIRVLDRSQRKKTLTAVWNEHENGYDPFSRTNKPYWLRADESPALTERLESLLSQVQAALPDILALTNRLAGVLDQGTAAAYNANALLLDARPIITNLAQITAQLRDPHGSLGEWLIPTNLQVQLTNTLASAGTTLTSANSTLTNTDAQITALAAELDRTLENLSAITSNLNAQVAANTNLVSGLSTAIINADDLVQGLKRHWLLRSAFKKQPTNAAPARAIEPKGGKRP